jgi:hypothetical protein
MDYDPDLVELADDPELVVSVEFCGQGACQAYLGDKAHGYTRIQKLPSLNAAVNWLHHSAHQYYPESRYARLDPLIH